MPRSNSPMPRTSDDYVRMCQGVSRQTKAAKAAKFDRILSSNLSKQAGLEKIAQGFIGPVMMRLKYEGIARNVLTEDPIAPGTVPVYDVADEMGRAYFLEPYQAEAVISQYEGKRVQYDFRHIAEFATVQEQDYYELNIDMAEYAVNEARQRIQELEDNYLVSLLDVAAAEVTPDTPDFSGQTTHVITSASASGAFEPKDFFNAHNVIINPADVYDVYGWDLTATSVAFRDKVFSGDAQVANFAGYTLWQSVMVRRGSAYVVADSDYVGRMPIRKELEVRPNDKVENFSIGFVLDERINEVILNSGSIYRIDK